MKYLVKIIEWVYLGILKQCIVGFPITVMPSLQDYQLHGIRMYGKFTTRHLTVSQGFSKCTCQALWVVLCKKPIYRIGVAKNYNIGQYWSDMVLLGLGYRFFCLFCSILCDQKSLNYLISTSKTQNSAKTFPKFDIALHYLWSQRLLVTCRFPKRWERLPGLTE